MRDDPSDERALAVPTTRDCPRCGSAATLPILWGFPAPELVQTMEGKVVFGGCCVPEDEDGGVANIECSACGLRWQVRATGNGADPDG